MNNKKVILNEVLNSSIEPPQALDYLEFIFNGVTFRAYGILHGITGGLNREYRDFIKSSISNIEGAKLAEKGMKQLYRGCGITDELEDWMVLRPIDSFIMGFQLIADPRCLWMITIDAIREQLRKRDAFITNERKNISDLGESPYFHYLDEEERREIAGFLPSEQAITNDLKSMTHWYSAIIPKKRHVKIDHPQWKRLLLLERIMHIPCRSIHMLHYASAYAKRHGHQQINLMVGETHNTDMKYFAENMNEFENALNTKQTTTMNKIIKRAKHYGESSTWRSKLSLISKKTNYLIMLLLGASTSIILYYISMSVIFNELS